MYVVCGMIVVEYLKVGGYRYVCAKARLGVILSDVLATLWSSVAHNPIFQTRRQESSLTLFIKSRLALLHNIDNSRRQTGNGS